MAKQTGPSHRVKAKPGRIGFGKAGVGKTGLGGAALGLMVLASALSGCSTDHWVRADKTPQETSADYKACNDRVEEMVMARRGQQRASYTPTTSARPPNGLPTGTGANLGETPMQMHDRVVAEKSFDDDVRTCMTDKGYKLAP